MTDTINCPWLYQDGETCVLGGKCWGKGCGGNEEEDEE